MKSIFMIFVMLLVTLTAYGQHRMAQDIILPTQKVLEDRTLSNVASASSSLILLNHDGDTGSGTSTTTSFAAQPDVARVLVVAAATSTDMLAGPVVINGWNAAGRQISDTFSFASATTTPVTGTKAFAKVRSIVFPAETGSRRTKWNVGTTERIGFQHCMDSADLIFRFMIDATATSSYTATIDSDELEKNYFTAVSAPNGSRDYRVLYVQNWNCR